MGAINRYLIVALLLACLAVVVLYIKGLNDDLMLVSQRVATLEARVETLEGQVTMLTAAQDETKTTVATHDKMITELELMINNK